MYKECCSTYESASLRMFRLGRTETIRSTTNDSFAFVKAMDDPAKQVSPLSFYPLSCVFVGMCEKVCVCVCVCVCMCLFISVCVSVFVWIHMTCFLYLVLCVLAELRESFPSGQGHNGPQSLRGHGERERGGI